MEQHQFRSQYSAEFSTQEIKSFTDENVDIAELVTKLQNLAKKHSSSLTMMGNAARQGVKLKARFSKLEKERRNK